LLVIKRKCLISATFLRSSDNQQLTTDYFSPMPRAFLPLLILSTALLAAPVPDLLFVGPLDTAVVRVGSTLDASVLASPKPSRLPPSPAALVARHFHPRFGEAVGMAARKVGVIDSSAALSARDPDSSRYVLLLKSLSFSESSVTVPRRYLPPTPPVFDPATGAMSPGNRKGYSEGPGRVTTLTARAQWIVWDNVARAPAARGTASGASSYRGAAGKSQWDEAARELAKAILRQTAFSPF
jgi:hypothetical protein